MADAMEEGGTRHAPFIHLREVAGAAVCAHWCAAADRGIAEARAAGPDAVDWSPSSSSLRLRAVTGIALDDVWRAVSCDPLRSACEALLGSRLVCNFDQCWLRRQYAPADAPPLHCPHAWHQDGALGFDFAAHAGPPWPVDALLEMVTCWIALTPCGVDAPGLELVAQRFDAPLAPADFEDSRIRARYASAAFRRPVLAAGDALLFSGGVVHRTHVRPEMTRDRTSLELRFFPADRPPRRLGSDRLSRPVCARRSAP